jgi:two-component system, NarL family, sensor histidine kinase NreB
MSSIQYENKYLRQIFENIQDGIIIMDQSRKILAMNPSAKKLTGWMVHDRVPYCSFCEQRYLRSGENTCYLIAHDEVPYFLSDMPTYHGKKINVEMSTALMYHDKQTDQKEYLLVLRDQSLMQKEKEAQLSKQMIQKLIEAKENEHKRLAQELHDGVGQALYSISVALQAIESFVNDKRIQTYVDDVREELNEVMNDIKAYSYQLRPQSIDRLGLIATINGLITTLKKSNPSITFTFSSNLTDRLPPLIEINLYRVIQEALHNMIKYADADEVVIELTELLHKLELTVRDNGIGFDMKKERSKGLGLKHMEERIHLLGGVFHIVSELQRGTIIRASIPKGEEFH